MKQLPGPPGRSVSALGEIRTRTIPFRKRAPGPVEHREQWRARQKSNLHFFLRREATYPLIDERMRPQQELHPQPLGS